LREALPGHRIVLVFPERLAPEAARYAGCGDKVWPVSPDGEVECYARGNAKALKTHLRNKVLRRALQARKEIKGLLKEYEMVREHLKLLSKGILATQKPLRDLLTVAAKLVLGDKLYPELADIPFLGPYHDGAIDDVKSLRELKEKISEKIVEVADEILKIETEFRVKKREGIHSYIMEEAAEEIEKSKKAKKRKQQENWSATNVQDDYITAPRKVLEEILEKIENIERSLKELWEAL